MAGLGQRSVVLGKGVLAKVEGLLKSIEQTLPLHEVEAFASLIEMRTLLSPTSSGTSLRRHYNLHKSGRKKKRR